MYTLKVSNHIVEASVLNGQFLGITCVDTIHGCPTIAILLNGEHPEFCQEAVETAKRIGKELQTLYARCKGNKVQFERAVTKITNS